MFSNVATHLKWGVIIVLFIIVIALMSKWSGSSANLSTSRRQLQMLIEDAAQYSSKSERDRNKITRLTNSSHAMAHIDAARKLFSDSEIEAATGVNLNELLSSIRYRHRLAVRQ